MKLLLAIAMSTLLSATAFGACTEAKDCKTKQDCEALSKGGRTFTFSASGQCLVVTSDQVQTDCASIADTTIGKSVPTAGGTSATPASGGRQR